MLLYGVCISDIDNVDEEKVFRFLEELSEDDVAKEHYLANFLDNKNTYDGEYSVSDWLYDFESDGYYGLSAFLKEVIEDIEGVNITCDDPNGVHYLGLGADAPWQFNSKTKNISEKEYESILRKYVSKVTDDVLDIRWWFACDEN